VFQFIGSVSIRPANHCSQRGVGYFWDGAAEQTQFYWAHLDSNQETSRR